jgi:SMC interacting uncharacterized protein involved in chromosome segregation
MSRVKDPRNLTSREYQTKVIGEMCALLMGLEYPHIISKEWLDNPNTKEFLDFVEFLLRQLDPNFIMPRAKHDEYLVKLAKYIGYPYAFQKNWVNPVGAPNTKGHLIGFLDFLVQMVNASRQYQVNSLLKFK